MKSTGITRRIDDLGRIVIPKEIRKNLKIKENEVLEIFINNEEIILKKFNKFNDIESMLMNYANTVYKITGNNIFITDRDKVIATSDNKQVYLNKLIGESINNVLDSRKVNVSSGKLELILNEEVNTNYIIYPIINNSDILGTIVMTSNNKLKDKDNMYVEIITKLIENYT